MPERVPFRSLSQMPRDRAAFDTTLTRRGLLGALALVSVGALWPVGESARASGADPNAFPTSRVVIRTHDDRRYTFDVEVAETQAQRARGLMYRRRLPPESGMLFDFGGVGSRAMWMKNTYIPLDILFLEEDGRIWKIAAKTTPMSEAIIPANGPIRAALEVNAGTCRLLGIEIGDVVEHPLFGSPPVE